MENLVFIRCQCELPRESSIPSKSTDCDFLLQVSCDSFLLLGNGFACNAILYDDASDFVVNPSPHLHIDDFTVSKTNLHILSFRRNGPIELFNYSNFVCTLLSNGNRPPDLRCFWGTKTYCHANYQKINIKSKSERPIVLQ